MKEAAQAIACNSLPIACVASSCVLAVHGIEGWGWFLFIGFLTSHTFKISSSETTKS